MACHAEHAISPPQAWESGESTAYRGEYISPLGQGILPLTEKVSSLAPHHSPPCAHIPPLAGNQHATWSATSGWDCGCERAPTVCALASYCQPKLHFHRRSQQPQHVEGW